LLRLCQGRADAGFEGVVVAEPSRPDIVGLDAEGLPPLPQRIRADAPPVTDPLSRFLLDRPDEVAVEKDRVTRDAAAHALADGPGNGAVGLAGDDGVADALAAEDIAVTEAGSPVRAEEQAVPVVVGHGCCLLRKYDVGEGRRKVERGGCRTQQVPCVT